MSSYSFSHEFYQHWTSAPQSVRAAIVQELKDITQLLRSETLFEEFVFSHHDLDAHLDDLYGAHDKQQAAEKALADEQAALRAEAERQRLEELENERLETERLEAKKAAENERLQDLEVAKEQSISEEQITAKSPLAKTHTLDAAKNETVADVDAAHKDTTTSKTAKVAEDQGIKGVDAQNLQKDSIDLSLDDTELNAAHQQMIGELEAHIDDYLTEQMLQLSETLKSWLRAEVTRQLSEK